MLYSPHIGETMSYAIVNTITNEIVSLGYLNDYREMLERASKMSFWTSQFHTLIEICEGCNLKPATIIVKKMMKQYHLCSNCGDSYC